MAQSIVWAGDLHIQKFNGLFGPEKALAMHLSNLDQCVRLARKNDSNHVCLVGDIYDTPFPTQLEQSALVLRLAAYHDINFLIYPGNHDRDDAEEFSMHFLETFKGVKALPNVTFVYQPELIKWAGARIWVLPWGFKKPPPDEAELVVFHHDMVGAVTDTGYPIEAGKGIERSFFRGKPAVSGHLHTPQQIKNVLYVGTPAQTTFGEPLPKKIWLTNIHKGVVKHRVIKHKPNWIFKTILDFDPNNPPDCNEENVYYKIIFNRKNQPQARWLAEHKQVIRVEPVKMSKKQKEQSALTLAGEAVSDDKLLTNWLSKHSSLTEKQLEKAIILDRRLGTSL